MSSSTGSKILTLEARLKNESFPRAGETNFESALKNQRPQNLGEIPIGNRMKKPLDLPHFPQPISNKTDPETEDKLKKIMKLNGILKMGNKAYKTEIKDLEDLGELGSGTSGHVVKMKHKMSGTIIAVKQMRRTGNEEENKRSIMDLDVVLKAHDCDYIVQCLGCFITESDVWICMELMAMCFDKLQKKSKIPVPEEILGKVTVATVKALSYLKEKDVIHRDVKPSNILIDERGNIKLCDFGISGRLVDSKARTRSAGCAAYMAPERIDPKKPDYDIRADVWSLGITLVELATGKFPYSDCATDFEVLTKVLTSDPPSLPKDRGFSLEFQDFVNKCLTKNYHKRPKYPELLEQPFLKHYEKQPIDVAIWFSSVMDKAGLKSHRRISPSPLAAELNRPKQLQQTNIPNYKQLPQYQQQHQAQQIQPLQQQHKQISNNNVIGDYQLMSKLPLSSSSSPIQQHQKLSSLNYQQLKGQNGTVSTTTPAAIITPSTTSITPILNNGQFIPLPSIRPLTTNSTEISKATLIQTAPPPTITTSTILQGSQQHLQQQQQQTLINNKNNSVFSNNIKLLKNKNGDHNLNNFNKTNELNNVDIVSEMNKMYKKSPFTQRRTEYTDYGISPNKKESTLSSIGHSIIRNITNSPFSQRKQQQQQQLQLQQQQQQQKKQHQAHEGFWNITQNSPSGNASPLAGRKRVQPSSIHQSSDQYMHLGNTSPIVLQRFYHQQTQLREKQQQDDDLYNQQQQQQQYQHHHQQQQQQQQQLNSTNPFYNHSNIPKYQYTSSTYNSNDERTISPNLVNYEQHQIQQQQHHHHQNHHQHNSNIPILQNQINNSPKHNLIINNCNNQQHSLYNNDCNDDNSSNCGVNNIVVNNCCKLDDDTNGCGSGGVSGSNLPGFINHQNLYSNLVYEKTKKEQLLCDGSTNNINGTKDDQGWFNSIAGVVKRRFASYVKLHLTPGDKEKERLDKEREQRRTTITSGTTSTNPFIQQQQIHQTQQQPHSLPISLIQPPSPHVLTGIDRRHRSPDPPPRYNRGQSPLMIRRNLIEYGQIPPGSPLLPARRYISSSPPVIPVIPPRRGGSESVPGSPQHFRTRIHYTPEPQRRIYRQQ